MTRAVADNVTHNAARIVVTVDVEQRAVGSGMRRLKPLVVLGAMTAGARLGSGVRGDLPLPVVFEQGPDTALRRDRSPGSFIESRELAADARIVAHRGVQHDGPHFSPRNVEGVVETEPEHANPVARELAHHHDGAAERSASQVVPDYPKAAQ